MSWQENLGIVLFVALIIIISAACVWYAIFQYNICMDKFDDFWYCVRHAGIL